MAEKIDGFPEGTATREGYSRYPWDSWLDGDVWSLTRGQDFTVTTKSFRSAATQAAKIRGGLTKTAVKQEKNDAGEVVAETLFIQYEQKASTPTQEDMTSEDMAEDQESVSV